MATRSDRQLVTDLRSLIGPSFDKRRVQLSAAVVKPSLGAVNSVAVKQNDPLTPTAGGIASPLTEQSRTEVIRTLTADDGTEIDVADASSITFLDANGATVVMNFSPPS